MNSNDRIQELVEKLQLLPHPEGGFYKETYRSEQTTLNGSRNLMTSIYFLLTGTNFSRFHRIKSDEAWYFHEGTSLIVHELSENGYSQTKLGLDFSKGEVPFHLVKSEVIFGSSVSEEEGYALVSCSVAPGFDFQDFELFETDTLLSQYPDHEEIIRKLS